jgi:hypothetical protein
VASFGAALLLATTALPGSLGDGSRSPDHARVDAASGAPAAPLASRTTPPAASRSRSPATHGTRSLDRHLPALERAISELRTRRDGPASALRHRDGLRHARGLALEAAGILARRDGAAFETGGLRHTPFELRKAGLPILNRRGRLHEKEGALVGRTGRLDFPPLAEASFRLDAAEALEVATRRAGVSALRATPRVEQGWHAGSERTEPAWRVTLPASQPFGTWQVTLHAGSGEVLELGNLLRFVTGTGRVYPENVATTPAPADAPLFELDDSGVLAGRFTQVFDVREVEAFRPDAFFAFPPSDPRFIQTSVYRGLSDAGRLGELHGFPPFAAPVPAFTQLFGDGPGDQYNNAFYDAFFPIFGFGNGDGVLTANLGTDLDVAAHEMGHHLFQVLVDPSAASSLSSLAAINEGVADTVAALVTGNPEIGESTLPGQPFLRTLANQARFPEDTALDPHEEGLIFGGLNWDLIDALGAGTFADVLIEGLPFLPTDSDDPADYRDALVQGDLVATGGGNGPLIRSLAAQRGLDFFEIEGFQGFVEEGVPRAGFLPDGGFHYYFFLEFPDSRRVRFGLGGTGDADLYAAPLAIFDPDDPTTYKASVSTDSSELVEFTGSSTPSVHEDDVWLVLVQDFPDGVSSSYSLAVETLLPSPGISVGGARTDDLAEGGEIDLVTFNGNAGQVVRLEGFALTQGLDLAVAIFDPLGFVPLGADDDSGEGTDPVIQGARLPASGTYAIAVFSLIGDVDPTLGTGDYRLELSRCTNTGANLDGDLLVDACDDDDDGDTFKDAEDAAPTDALACQDIEDDGCDDCSGGAFEPFDDGLDSDGDALCDSGDSDDDNDGCDDADDPAPQTPSVDDDLDFVGLDCDNCPDHANHEQLDGDGDGTGDVCEVPEPGTLVQATLALAVLAGIARRRQRSMTGTPSTALE